MTLVLLALSTVVATLPMLGFLWLVWWLDRYDREPPALLGLAYLWGALGAVTIACAGNTAGVAVLGELFHFELDQGRDVGALLFAPLIEEPTKALILLLVSRSRHFDNATDGFVYGAAAGLGFATTENFTYFAAAAAGGPLPWVGVVLARTLFSALMHAVATSVVGAALGWTRFQRALDQLGALLLGLALAVGVHGLWNGLLVADPVVEANGALAALDFLLFPVEFLIAFAVFQICLRHERQLLLQYLSEEAAQGHLPSEHVHILASWWRRIGKGWLPGHVRHDDYVRDATLLAFRRHQRAMARGEDRDWMDEQIQHLRARLARQLAGPPAVRPPPR